MLSGFHQYLNKRTMVTTATGKKISTTSTYTLGLLETFTDLCKSATLVIYGLCWICKHFGLVKFHSIYRYYNS